MQSAFLWGKPGPSSVFPTKHFCDLVRGPYPPYLHPLKRQGELSTMPLNSQECLFIQQTPNGGYLAPGTVYKFMGNTTINKVQTPLSQSLEFSGEESQVNI